VNQHRGNWTRAVLEPDLLTVRPAWTAPS
jgi:hypothetical protein